MKLTFTVRTLAVLISISQIGVVAMAGQYANPYKGPYSDPDGKVYYPTVNSGKGADEFDWQAKWGSIHMNTHADGLKDPGSPGTASGLVQCTGSVCHKIKNYPEVKGLVFSKSDPKLEVDNGIKFDIKNSLLNCLSVVLPNWAATHEDSIGYSQNYVCRKFQRPEYGGAQINLKPRISPEPKHTITYSPIYDRRSNDDQTETTLAGAGCQQQIVNQCGGTNDIHSCQKNPGYGADKNPDDGYKHPVSHVFTEQEKSDLGNPKQLPTVYYKYSRISETGKRIEDDPKKPAKGTYLLDDYSVKEVSFDCTQWSDPELTQKEKSKCVVDVDAGIDAHCTAKEVEPNTDCECSIKTRIGEKKTCHETRYSYTPITNTRRALALSSGKLKDQVPYSEGDVEKIDTSKDPNLARLKSYEFDVTEGGTGFIIMDPSDFYDLKLYTSTGKYAAGYKQFDAYGRVATYDSCPVLGLKGGYSGICDPNGVAGCNLPVYGIGPTTNFTDAGGDSYQYSDYPVRWSGFVKKWAVISKSQYLKNIQGREKIYADGIALNDNPILMLTRADEYCDPREMSSVIGTYKTPLKKDLPCAHYLQYQSTDGFGKYEFVNLFTPDEDPYQGKVVVEYNTLHLYDLDANGNPIATSPVKNPAYGGSNIYVEDGSILTGYLSFFDKTATYKTGQLTPEGVPIKALAVVNNPDVVNTIGQKSPGSYLDGKTALHGVGVHIQPGTANSVRMPADLKIEGKSAKCAIIVYGPKANKKIFIPTNSQAEFQSFVKTTSKDGSGIPGFDITSRPCSAHYLSNTSPQVPAASPAPLAKTKTWLGMTSCDQLAARPICNHTKMISAKRYCRLESGGTLDDCSACDGAVDDDSAIMAKLMSPSNVNGEIIVNPATSTSKCYFSAACFNINSTGCPEANSSGGHVFCLAPETKIVMADGTQKEISKIKAGEEVMSFNAKSSRNGVLTKVKVKATAITKKQEILKINDLKITPQHKIILANGRAVAARDIRVGDNMLKADGLFETVTSVDSNLQPITVYNLVLDKGADGYVANGIRVLSYPILKGMESK